MALFGTLSQTSKHDVDLHTGSPVIAAKRSSPARGRRRARAPAAAARTPAGRTPHSPAEAALRKALSTTIRVAGAGGAAVNVGVLVYDIGDRAELFGLHSTVKRPPASVEKLWTTTALMLKVGPNARLHTTVLGTGFERDGVWHGNLYLRGGGDPTFGDPTFNRVWNQGYGPTANQLVAQLRARGIRRVTGHVIGDESLFDTKRGGMRTQLRADIPDFGGQLSALTYDHGATAPRYNPATFAARELTLTMRGVHIGARASPHTGRAPAGAHLLAIVSSPKLATMTRLMDVPSDDLFAELFTKQLGVLFGRGGTIADGAHVTASTVAGAYNLHPTIIDGSGLSHHDRSSPLEVVDLLRDVWRTPVGDELSASLPTVGVNGTVKFIGTGTAAQGHCLAKTGTLTGVTNLAGYCHSRGHKMLAFALFIDGPDNSTAILEESKMVAAIARY